MHIYEWFKDLIWRRERDSNPRNGFPFSGFQDHRHRPLGHPSASKSRLNSRASHVICRQTGVVSPLVSPGAPSEIHSLMKIVSPQGITIARPAFAAASRRLPVVSRVASLVQQLSAGRRRAGERVADRRPKRAGVRIRKFRLYIATQPRLF
jgi:hypothetical protein